MELVDKIHEFLREYYYADVQRLATEEKPALVIDFSLIDIFDPLIADELLQYPDKTIQSFQDAVKTFDIEIDRINIRVRNLPDNKSIRLRNLRAEHIGKLIRTDIIVKSATEIKPQIYDIVFLCPECNNKISVPQDDSPFIQKPSSCICGFRGEFKELERKMYDFRWLRGVEPFEITTGEQPSETMILLKEDLTTPKMQKKTDPGNRLRITGILKDLPKRIKGKVSTRLDTYLDAVHVEPSGIDFEDLEITADDEKKIIELSRDPSIFERLKASIAPGIYGFSEIKEALAMQLFGGVSHVLPDGSRTRGNIHILLTGDPGVGKSVVGSSKILINSKAGVEYAGIGNLIDDLVSNKSVRYNGADVSLNDSEIKVITLNPKTHEVEWKHVSAFIRHDSPDKLIKIQTASGREIVATKDHSFVTMNSGGDIAILKGSEIALDSFVPIPMNTHKEVIGNIKISQETKTNAREIASTIKLGWDCGFFFGMFLAEGSLSKGTMYIDTQTDESKEIIAKFLRQIGLKSNISKTRLYTSSVALVNFLNKECYSREKIGSGKGSGAIRKRLPSFCFFAPLDFVHGLVSGMFSGDGYFQNTLAKGKRTKDSLKICYASISRDLSDGLIELLSSVGIFASCRKKKYVYKGQRKTCYITLITGEHVGKFIKNVRLVGKTPKTQRLSEKDSLDCLPCTELLYDIVKSLGFSRRLIENANKRRAFAAMMRTVKKRNKIGRRRMKRIYEILLNECKAQRNQTVLDKITKLKNILDSNIIWDRITEVEEMSSNEKYVYDLSIDGNETFSANNIIVHNTQLLKLAANIVPRARYVSGSGVSGVGLTASVRKDEVLGSWVLEAGALILCNNGLISIDEFDKMSKDDQIAMHEATSVETVSIAKASIVATLPAQTAVLAGANPKYGRFDPYKSVLEQLDISETLLSRFDLKFALKDKPDRQADERVAEHITMSRISPQNVVPEIDPNLLKKYIAYAKRITSIEITQEAAELMKKFYVDMRNAYPDSNTVSITLRQYEALLRLAEAAAKIRLDTRVSVEDAQRSINLVRYSLIQLGYDYETGRIDIDKLESGITSSQRSKIRIIQDIITALEKELGKEVNVEDVIAQAEEQGIERNRAEETIRKLKDEGLVFEPKPGFIKRT